MQRVFTGTQGQGLQSLLSRENIRNDHRQLLVPTLCRSRVALCFRLLRVLMQACRIVCWGLPTGRGVVHHAPSIRLGDLDSFIALSLESHPPCDDGVYRLLGSEK
jgi:hypothetical protein